MNNYEEFIKNLFRQAKCKPGHIVPMRNINNSLLNRLNPEEQKQCLEVINNMIASGFCTYEKDTLECLRLTDKGYEGLYPKKSLEELEEVILDIFRRTNSNVGEGFMERQLRNLERDLNPEDARTLIEAANNLIQEGYCIYEAQPSGFFKLTKKGYDRIYKATKGHRSEGQVH